MDAVFGILCAGFKKGVDAHVFGVQPCLGGGYEKVRRRCINEGLESRDG